ncbi:MAG: branched-chain amino acid ABC transporter permease [Acidimicrobiales bacterium]
MDWASIIENGIKAGVRPEAAYFALAAIGLNIHFGYTGLLNFGQAGFMAMGAYGLAIPVFAWDWPWWTGVFIGLAASVIFAFALGVPTLRLRADYLAIVTIAAAEIVRFIFRATDLREYTGGSNGINGFSTGFFDLSPFTGTINIGPFDFTAREMWVMVVGWGLVFAGIGLTYLMIDSPWGRVLKAVREDEDAARALGKNAYSMKMQSLIIGGLYGALAGMILALSQGSVQPSPTDLGPPKTFFAYAALILGGTGRLWGPVIGSVLFISLLAFTDNILRQAQAADYIPESFITGTEVGVIRFVLLGIGLMALMLFRPQGIFGDRREMAFDV